ncbi:class F sortase [Saccharopolyspora rosea]|uniref:Class F sortase n=1 Tax=Saccharopolyspora rosea TaxID=524884 RepID=A0ABW3FZ80_9PSEU|nr:class F sortase [Saccharopolyspora rosea]
MRSWRRRVPEIALALGLLVAAAGLAHWLVGGPELPRTGTVPAAHAGPDPAPERATPLPASPDEAPRGVHLPTLGVNAPVDPVLPGRDGGLGVPGPPGVVGWWSAGAAPGARRGTVVLAGHVDTQRGGRGAFFRVGDLQPGDPVTVTTARSTVRYRIAAVRGYPKASLPPDVFDRTGRPRLVLITCGGPFDEGTKEYADNVVAYAVPA